MSENGNGDDNNNNIRFENSSSYGRISSNQDSLYFRENTLHLIQVMELLLIALIVMKVIKSVKI